MKAPETYAEWNMMLKSLREGGVREDILQALSAGKLEWQDGVAQRFAQQLSDTINTIINKANDVFSRQMQQPNGGEGAAVQGLLHLRRELGIAQRLASLPVLPEDVRQDYQKMVQEQADRMQQSLEDSARKSDRSGKLLSIVRNHRVNA
jgi:hypothetical protein